MNIIGNSCAASYVTRDLLKEKFCNPFTWCSCTEADIVFIINHFHEIDFSKFNAVLYDNKALNSTNVKIVVDNVIEIKYPHYCLSKYPFKIEGINVFSSNIIDWAVEKYTKRCERMSTAGSPFYVLGGTWEDQAISLSTKTIFYNSNNVFIMDTKNIYHDNYAIAIKNFESIKNKLENFTG